MRKDEAALPRYLAEWYVQRIGERTIADIAERLRHSLGAMPQPGGPALLYAVHVPQDDYAFVVFSAGSAELVALACREAGFPADRVTAALEVPPVTGSPAVTGPRDEVTPPYLDPGNC